jgi:streptogramin lyase
MTTTPDDTLWIGTAGGLFAYQSTETGRVRIETHPAMKASSWVVSDVIGEDDGALWIGTSDRGLQYWHSATSKLSTIDTIANKAITVLAQDHTNNIWVGTRDGLARGNRSEGFERFVHQQDNPQSIHSNVVTALYIQPDGGLYVSTEQGGVQAYQPNSNDFQDLHQELTGLTTTAMVRDQQDNLWIGTLGHGIFVVDGKTESVRRYHTHNSGLPDNDIQGLILGVEGSVWVSTGRGVASCTAGGRFRVFDTDDGLASLTFHRNAYARDHSGRLYFGGDQGVGEINLDKLPKGKVARQPILTGLEINGDKQEPSETNAYMKKPTGSTKSFSLPFNRGTRVGLTFTTLDYTVPARSQFRYRLIPLERKWSDAGKERRASYTGLSPGGYHFEVQASLDGECWNQNSAVINIQIPPPWYLTWWFLIGSALISFGLVAGVMVRLSRKRHQGAWRQQEILENERNKAEAALADGLQGTMLLQSATETSDSEDLYKVTLERIVQHFNSSYGGIYSIDLDGESLNLICQSFASDTITTGLGSLSYKHVLFRNLLGADKPVVVSDIATDERMDPWRGALFTSVLEAVLILPTMNQGEVSGLVIVAAEHPTVWRTEDICLMGTVASQI